MILKVLMVFPLAKNIVTLCLLHIEQYVVLLPVQVPSTHICFIPYISILLMQHITQHYSTCPHLISIYLGICFVLL